MSVSLGQERELAGGERKTKSNLLRSVQWAIAIAWRI